MTNSKLTKRSLLASSISLLLCFAMLLGTTFAWFTDSATSAGNKIIAGNLDVELYMYDGTSYTNIGDSKDPIFSSEGATAATSNNLNTLWEPGKTQVAYLMIKNNGNLALKYEVALNTINPADSKDLYKVMQYQIVPDAKSGATWTAGNYVTTGTAIVSANNVPMQPGDEHYFALLIHMDEEAGNEYMNGKVEFDITVLATQFNKEEDSFGNEYDAEAGYYVHVNPDNIQAAIHEAEPGDVLYLDAGTYGDLVLENADGSPKRGITLEHDKPGTNSASNPFSVGHINLNSSEDITISGIWFDITKAKKVYSRSGETNYYANITGAKNGAASGPKNIVIDNCLFDTQGQYWAQSTINPNNYVPICFEEASRPTFRATNITVKNCTLNKDAFNFIRACYLSEGALIVQNNRMMPRAKLSHAAIVCSSNSADLMIRDNAFYNWNSEKAMLSTSRNGSHNIKVEVTGNNFSNTLTGEGVVLDIKSSYTADNCTVVFEGNTFSGGLAGLNEETVPCVKP